jgi:hypothetical protein
MDSGEASLDKIGAVRHLLTTKPMTAIAKEKRIDSKIHAGGMRGVERACT